MGNKQYICSQTIHLYCNTVYEDLAVRHVHSCGRIKQGREL